MSKFMPFSSTQIYSKKKKNLDIGKKANRVNTFPESPRGHVIKEAEDWGTSRQLSESSSLKRKPGQLYVSQASKQLFSLFGDEPPSSLTPSRSLLKPCSCQLEHYFPSWSSGYRNKVQPLIVTLNSSSHFLFFAVCLVCTTICLPMATFSLWMVFLGHWHKYLMA
jgi:hypothetical protein